MSAKYDRDAAMAYARKYWNKVASDGFLAQSPTPRGGYKKLDPATTLVHEVYEDGRQGERAESPDGTIIDWKPLDDCSHFISCCIGDEPAEHGGGLHVPFVEQLGAPGHRPYGIVGAPRLAQWLAAVPGIRMIEIAFDDRTNIDLAKPGDVIGCRGTGGRFAYEHFMLYLGDGKIACHTYSRCDAGGEGWTDEWDNDWSVGGDSWATGWTIFAFD